MWQWIRTWAENLLTSLFFSTRKSTVQSLNTSRLRISSALPLLSYASLVLSKSMWILLSGACAALLVWEMSSTGVASTTAQPLGSFSSRLFVDAAVDRHLPPEMRSLPEFPLTSADANLVYDMFFSRQCTDLSDPPLVGVPSEWLGSLSGCWCCWDDTRVGKSPYLKRKGGVASAVVSRGNIFLTIYVKHSDRQTDRQTDR